MADRETIEKLAYSIRGTCQTPLAALEALGIEDDGTDWEDVLLDENVEICVVCHWWHEVCELEFDETLNGGVCDSCRESENG